MQREREGWNLVGARDDFKSIALESMSYAQMRKTRKSNYISFGDEEHAALNFCRQQVVEVAAMKLNLHMYACGGDEFIFFVHLCRNVLFALFMRVLRVCLLCRVATLELCIELAYIYMCIHLILIYSIDSV